MNDSKLMGLLTVWDCSGDGGQGVGAGPAGVPARHEEDGHAAHRRQPQLLAQCPAAGEPQQRSHVENRRRLRSGEFHMLFVQSFPLFFYIPLTCIERFYLFILVLSVTNLKIEKKR